LRLFTSRKSSSWAVDSTEVLFIAPLCPACALALTGHLGCLCSLSTDRIENTISWSVFSGRRLSTAVFQSSCVMENLDKNKYEASTFS
jgi:hypothetical protein